MEARLLGPGDPAPEIHARPVFGLPLDLPGDLARGPVALCFVPPLHSARGRLALSELQEAWPALDRRGLRVVAICPSEPAEAQDYVPRHQLLFPVVLDPDRALARRCGVEDDPGLRRTLATLSPARLSRALGALGHGRGRLGGPHAARAAVILLDRDGRVRWAAQADSALDGLDLGGLLAALEGGA